MQKTNVIYIIMDDLCYGDLACHGNPYIKTPHLDKLYVESTRFTRYCTGPLCSPARASVMTGRYHQRTRVIDTYCGRSMIDPDEITLAKCFKSANYATGAFGKWHLGDCYPMRAMDLGFDEVLMHNGGGIGQPGDHHDNFYRELEDDEPYFNPTLYKNGIPEKTEGYCTDIFTDATIDFIENNQNKPFFIYLATNAPHSPLQIADKWADTYRNMGINDTHARLYGMVENIDMNVGRILDKLEKLKLSENTIVIFTSDHGPCPSARDLTATKDKQTRYNSGLRGIKGTMYQGGIKVPSFWRLPKKFEAGKDIDTIAHPVDALPTLLNACNIELPDVKLDGINLMPLLSKEEKIDNNVFERNLFMQWHRGNVPIKYKNYAVISQQYKVYRPEDQNNDELYDLLNDPYEKNDLAKENPEKVEEMRTLYDKWFEDIALTRGLKTFDNPLIHIGTEYENPTVLSQNDWRLTWDQENWQLNDLRGHWDVFAKKDAYYNITLRFRPNLPSGKVFFTADTIELKKSVENNQKTCTFQNVQLPKGKLEIEAWLQTNDTMQSARYQRFISAVYIDLEQVSI